MSRPPREPRLWKPTAELRRSAVRLLSRKGLSNREIARRLKCDEGTVRRDLKFLRTPVSKRPPAKEPRLKKPKIITPEQRVKQFFKAAKDWFRSEGLIRPDALFIVAEAARRLHLGQQAYSHLTDSTLSPTELLSHATPRREVDLIAAGAMPEKLEYSTNWFARWVALNWPKDGEVREGVLTDMTRWAEKEL